jgi:hypothetical protein
VFSNRTQQDEQEAHPDDDQSDQSDQSNLYVVAFYPLRAVSRYSLPEKSTKAERVTLRKSLIRLI